MNALLGWRCRWMVRIFRLALLVGIGSAAAAFDAPTESEMQLRYCAGMQLEVPMPDNTFADCLSPTHAIEVEFSRKWAESLGQALHYALWTADPVWNRSIDDQVPKKAGIILLCVDQQDTCTGHFVRLLRVVEEYKLPVTIWDCDPRTDLTLDDCQAIDQP